MADEDIKNIKTSNNFIGILGIYFFNEIIVNVSFINTNLYECGDFGVSTESVNTAGLVFTWVSHLIVCIKPLKEGRNSATLQYGFCILNMDFGDFGRNMVTPCFDMGILKM